MPPRSHPQAARKRAPKKPAPQSVALTSYPTPAQLPPGVIMVRELFAPQQAANQQRQRFGRALSLDRIEAALRAAWAGSMKDLTDLSRETIDTDPHLASVLTKRLRAAPRLKYDVVPAEGEDVDPEKADFYARVVRSQLRAMKGFRRTLGRLAWGLFDGRAAEELVWTPAPGLADPRFGQAQLALAGTSWIHPRRLSFGPMRELRIIDDSQYGIGAFKAIGIALEDPSLAYKFAYWTPQLFGDYPEREGLCQRVLYWSFFKRWGARERMILAELFGKPWRWVEVDEESSASPTDLADAEVVADSFGGTYTGRMPRGTRLKVERPNHDDGKIHADIIASTNEEISKLVLGQTATTDAKSSGLNSNQAEVHSEEQDDVLETDAELIAEVVEDYITDAIIAVNFGYAETVHAPGFRLVTKSVNTVVGGDRLNKALDAGLEISRDEAYEVVGFRVPAEGEEVVRKAPAPAFPGGGGFGGFGAPQLPPGDPMVPQLPEPPQIDVPGPTSVEPQVAEADIGLSDVLRDAGLRARVVEAGVEECLRCAGDHEQPAGPYGSVETVLDRGMSEARRAVAAIAKAYTAAAERAASPAAALSALIAARRGLDTRPLGRALERRMVMALALGALDADAIGPDGDDGTEPAPGAVSSGGVVRPPPVAVQASGIRLADRGDFAGLPFETALRIFRGKSPIQRAAFDKLSARAKQRAFTVAGVVADDALALVQDELAQHVGRGASMERFAAAMEERLKSAGFLASLQPLADGREALRASHVETVFRTNTLGAYNAARAEQMTQPNVLAKRPVWMIRSVQDGRTRETHKVVNGVKLLATDPFWRGAYPPFGYNCFLPGTVVEGAVIGASKARYAGKVVELRTAVGGRLSVTANHPVLTPRGIVAAQALREGDQVLGYRSEAGVSALRPGSERYEHQAPAVVEEVFNALAQAGSRGFAGYRADDFHGEAKFFRGEIDVVGTYRKLLDYAQAAGAEYRGELWLEATDAAAARQGAASQLLGRGLPTSASNVRGRGLLPALPSRHAGPLQPLRLGLASRLDPRLPESAVDDLAAYSAFVRELLDRCSGAVFVDEIVDVRQYDSLVHVYDLESATGWVVAGGILSSNCRCRVISLGQSHLSEVVSGTTIVGLPDEGFASGIAGLLDPNP